MHRRSAKVAAAQIGELAALPADEVNPALNGANDGREDAVLSGRAAKMVANEVLGVVIDMKAVRDVVAVESKGRAGDGDGYPTMLVSKGFEQAIAIKSLQVYVRLAAPTDATNPAVSARAVTNRLGDVEPSIVKSDKARRSRPTVLEQIHRLESRGVPGTAILYSSRSRDAHRLRPDPVPRLLICNTPSVGASQWVHGSFLRVLPLLLLVLVLVLLGSAQSYGQAAPYGQRSAGKKVPPHSTTFIQAS